MANAGPAIFGTAIGRQSPEKHADAWITAARRVGGIDLRGVWDHNPAMGQRAVMGASGGFAQALDRLMLLDRKFKYRGASHLHLPEILSRPSAHSECAKRVCGSHPRIGVRARVTHLPQDAQHLLSPAVVKQDREQHIGGLQKTALRVDPGMRDSPLI